MMSDEDSVIQPFDCLQEDDCSRGFGFGAEDESVMIDIESIYRILDEEPESMEVWLAKPKCDVVQMPNFWTMVIEIKLFE